MNAQSNPQQSDVWNSFVTTGKVVPSRKMDTCARMSSRRLGRPHSISSVAPVSLHMSVSVSKG